MQNSNSWKHALLWLIGPGYEKNGLGINHIKFAYSISVNRGLYLEIIFDFLDIVPFNIYLWYVCCYEPLIFNK